MCKIQKLFSIRWGEGIEEDLEGTRRGLLQIAEQADWLLVERAMIFGTPSMYQFLLHAGDDKAQ
jgi:hypothetical protein